MESKIKGGTFKFRQTFARRRRWWEVLLCRPKTATLEVRETRDLPWDASPEQLMEAAWEDLGVRIKVTGQPGRFTMVWLDEIRDNQSTDSR